MALFGSKMNVPVIWSLDCSDYDPECPGPPPPFFHIPPPPRPPFLHDLPDCSLDLDTCNAMPVIDAEYHSSPAMPSIAVIVTSSLFLLTMVLIATALVCKHKRKVQNFLPCKSSPQTHCDISKRHEVIYEDLTNIRPRPLPQPSIEMLDVNGRVDMGYQPSNYPVLSRSPVFICPPPPRTLPRPQYCSQDLYNPVYEELSNGSAGRGGSEGDSEFGRHGLGSEDEFAEDELSLAGVTIPVQNSGTSSLQGSTGNDLSRDADSSDTDDRLKFKNIHNCSLPSNCRRETSERRRKSLDRKRVTRNKLECAEFHEGLLLDALLQLYPKKPTSDSHHKLPYILPVPPNQYDAVLQYHSQPRQTDFTAFRPSHDSDSGYSYNTSGGRGSTSRGRKRSQRFPSSNDIVIS